MLASEAAAQGSAGVRIARPGCVRLGGGTLKDGNPVGPTEPPPAPVVAEDVGRVKAELVDAFASMLDRLFDGVDDGSATQRALEIQLWKELLVVGRLALAYLFGLLSWKATQQDLKLRGLGRDDVRLRLDRGYWGTLMTTLGPVTFPFFAYRDPSSGVATVTRTPAKESVFPYHSHCRSSVLCLEWQTRSGAAHPFRRAEEELAFFTQGSITTEDTTIAKHLVRVASMIDRSWLYKEPDEIRDILRNRATKDQQTGKPIIYASSDAHAERRYVDDTWRAQWKMVNGIRIWCEDRETGQIVHLGGEFTWGDCHEVKKAFEALIEARTLPKDGDYGDGVVAQLAWISDAMPWFDDHILPLFPDATVILDVYHLIRWFSVLAAILFKAGSKAAKKLVRSAEEAIFGPTAKRSRAPTPRRGHKKRRMRALKHAHDHASRKYVDVARSGDRLAKALLDLLTPLSPKKKNAKEELEALGNRICNNVLRMGYQALLSRGFQIGSGAMESIHRTGCQLRAKLPGARWLEETAQAIFNVRMLQLVGNWDAFWKPGRSPQAARRRLPRSNC